MSHAATTWAFAQRDISPVDKFVLVVLADAHNGHTGQCNPSIPRISEFTGYHRATVIRAIESLEAVGLIRVARTPGKSTHYELVLSLDTSSTARPVAESDGSQSATTPVAACDPTGRTVRRHPSQRATRTGREPEENRKGTQDARNSQDAWSEVVRLTADSGAASARAGPRTNAAVSAIGGWHRLGRMSERDLDRMRPMFAKAWGDVAHG